MLKLPGVTLVLRDVLCPELARLAVLDTLALIEPEDTLIFSDIDLNIPKTEWVKVPKWSTLLDHCTFFWHEQHKFVKTPWFLSIEWDGWVIDAGQWSDEYLKYDFIGAPWWHDDGFNVGNGLGVRSNKLMQFLSKNRDVFPVKAKEDEVLGRVYRPKLEANGFKWAPEKLASRFSFECARPAVWSKHFMFHDSFNFSVVLEPERLNERLQLMRSNSYISSGHKLHELEQGRRAIILDRLAD
jgi:hypothetical protein